MSQNVSAPNYTITETPVHISHAITKVTQIINSNSISSYTDSLIDTLGGIRFRAYSSGNNLPFNIRFFDSQTPPYDNINYEYSVPISGTYLFLGFP